MKSTAFSEQVEQAHELLRLGKREEARQIVDRLLKANPGDMQARALRDRLDSEVFSEAVVREKRTRDGWLEYEDIHPALHYSFLLIGIAALLFGTWIGYRPVRYGLEQGFGVEALGRMGRAGSEAKMHAHYPVHLFLIYPLVLYGMAFLSFTIFRRSHHR